jgi:hypothetical protein
VCVQIGYSCPGSLITFEDLPGAAELTPDMPGLDIEMNFIGPYHGLFWHSFMGVLGTPIMVGAEGYLSRMMQGTVSGECSPDFLSHASQSWPSRGFVKG